MFKTALLGVGAGGQSRPLQLRPHSDQCHLLFSLNVLSQTENEGVVNSLI